MSKKYQVVVKAVLDQVDLQKQLDAVSTQVHQKNTKAVQKQSSSVEKLNNQVIRWQNELKKTELRYPKAFNTESVQNLNKEFVGLFDTYKAGGISTDEMRTRLHSINTEMVRQKQVVKEGSERVGTFGNQIALAARKVAQWAIATSIIYGTLHAIQQGTEYIKELDKAMTNIRVVTQSTKQETRELAQSYNELASELGVTTVEVAEGATEWLRQGESIENTQKLLESTIMLAKLGNTTTAEATEYLISTLNGFKLEAEDAIGVVDKLINLDNQYATSAGELASALQRSSASAQQAGVTFDELISYITTVSSVTRQSAESIGVSFRTMFARMQRVKIGAEFDEAGESISDVENVLAKAGIQLRDTADSFRPLGDVLDEVASKWDTLGQTQQSQVAEAIAGVRQRENFLVLMQNYNTALEAQEKAINSSGIAQERYALYLESVEAAANKAKAAWEGMWQATASGEGIKTLYNLSAAVADLITNIGGLATPLTILLGLIIALKATQIADTITKIGTSFTSLTSILGALTGAAAGTATALTTVVAVVGGITVIVGLVMALAGGINYLSKAAERNKEAFEELSRSAEAATTAYKNLNDEIDQIKSLWERYEALKALEEQGTATADELKELIGIQNRLNELSGGTILGTYDEELNFIISKNASLETTISLLERELELRKEIALESAKSAAIAGEDVAEDLEKEAEKLKNIIEGQLAKGEFVPGETMETDWVFISQEQVDEARRRLNEIELEQIQHASAVLDVYKTLTTDKERQEFKAQISSQKALDAIRNYEIEVFKDREETLQGYWDRIAKMGPPEPQEVELIKLDTAKFREEFEEFKSKVSQIRQLQEDVAQGRDIDTSKLPEDIADNLDIVDGKWELADEKVKQYIQSQYDGIQSTYELTDAQKSMFDGVISSADNARTFTYDTVSLTREQFQTISSDMAQVLYQAAEAAGIVLYDIQGTALTSSENIQAALLAGLATFNSISVQMANNTAAQMGKVANYVSGLFDFAGGITPYKPTIPYFGGGGGGGGKSPEQQAIEDQTDAIEDLIRTIERQNIGPLLDEIKSIQRNQLRKIEDTIKQIERTKIRPIKDEIDRIRNDIIRPLQDEIDQIERDIIRPLQDEIDQIERDIIRPLQDEIDRIIRDVIRPLRDEIDRIRRDVIRPIQDEIDRIRIETIRPLQDEIERIQDEHISALEEQIDLQNEQIDLIDEQIDALEKTKEPLKEELDAFKELISAQKESLRVQREEEQFNKKLGKQNEDLAKLKTKIALLALDDSESARKERLRLEDEAAKLEEDIAESKEDRKYELQIDALDNLQEEFERNIQEQIDAIDDVIKQREKEKEAIQAVIDTIEDEIETWEERIELLQEEIDYWEDIIETMEREIEAHERVIEQIEREIEAQEEIIEQIEREIEAQERAIEQIERKIEGYEEEIEVLQRRIEEEERGIETLERQIEKHEEYIETLEREKEKWEDLIEQRRRAMEVFQDEIDSLRDRMDLLRDEASESFENISSSGGAAWQNISDEVKKYMEELEKARALLTSFGIDLSGLSAQAIIDIYAMTKKWQESGMSIDEAAVASQTMARVMADALDNVDDSLTDTQDEINDVRHFIGLLGVDTSSMTDDAIIDIGELIQQWISEGLTIDEIRKKIENLPGSKTTNLDVDGNAISKLDEIKRKIDAIKGKNVTITTTHKNVYQEHEGGLIPYHKGGSVETHHDGESFAGGLRSNEVFAKLLKGEYVATENQMDKFIRKTLPSIINRSSNLSDSQKTNTIGDVNFDIDIAVQGSLDKSVVPDLKDAVLKEINKSLYNTGLKRNAVKFSI